MTPEKFITTWTENDLTERAGAQAFIEDLCELLKIPKPRKSDDFCYEKGVKKDGGGQGWADVWKRDHFGWENKKPKRDLKQALAQLREYSGNLGNPPLLIVCDRELIEIHTAFTGYPDEPRTIRLQEIGDPKNLQILHWVFTDPEKLKPIKSNAHITTEAAAKFSTLATSMRKRGIKPQTVAHFLTQCIFCLFAEDEGLLTINATDDSHIFTNLLNATRRDPKKAADRIKTLFTAMQEKGGQYGNDDIHWFNGGLFKTISIPELNTDDLTVLFKAANELDWRSIDPTIFGTLFERGLDPNCRAQLGAHYTDVNTIKKIIDPLITEPLTAQWQAVKVQMLEFLAKEKSVKTASIKKQHRKAAQDLYHGYLEQLRNFRVLDAACGSGNFLYLSLHALKDLEHIAQLDAEALGFEKQLLITAGTDNVLGMEINEYAAELARVTVWIGDIQWCQRNGRQFAKNPILHSLNGIQHKDALLNSDGTETKWAKADVIVGNPPFLGDKKMLKELGDDYVAKLRQCYKGRVAGGADLVCYWFEKARGQIEKGKAKAAGLVSTNSIRGGANRTVLDNICKTMPIFAAWSDEDWFDNGAAVRVSLVCFGHLKSPLTPLFQRGEKKSDTAVSQQEQNNSDSQIFQQKTKDTIPPFEKGGEKKSDTAVSQQEQNNSGSQIFQQKTKDTIPPFEKGGEKKSDTADSQQEQNNSGSQIFQQETKDAIPPFEKGGQGGFKPQNNMSYVLNGKLVAVIHADLTAGDGEENADITQAKILLENAKTSFIGTQKNGAFDVSGELARQWLKQPNPHGQPNSQVVRPWANGMDINRRPSDTWIIDFGVSMNEADASLFELPFKQVETLVKPMREKVNREGHRKYWWRHGETRNGLRKAIAPLNRFIATSMVSKHRFFVWLPKVQIPENLCVVIARSDDTTFGILHSRFHELWALGLGTSLEDRPRYTPTTCFETFPFPTGLSPADTANNQASKRMNFDAPIPAPVSNPDTLIHAKAIAEAAFKLNQLRDNWLNPPEWVQWVISPEEQAAGFPKRPKAKAGHETLLKKRTLTNLYNERPAWLNSIHQTLDKAVANAYGWYDYSPETTDADILQRLLKLNLTRG
jgi:type II restriction/modification system DNA methylase subunit YeeA